MGETETTAKDEKKTAVPLKERITRAFLAAPRGMHILLLVICLCLGTALVTQVRSQRNDPLERLNQEDLVIFLDELDDRERILRGERSELQSRLRELEDAASQQSAALQAAREREELAGINAGTLPVAGEGVEMHVTDTGLTLGAPQFVMTLGELRNAGAEAVELNGIRLTMRTSFTSDSSGVLVNGQRISGPYIWKAIGPAMTMATALEIRAGSAAQMRAKGARVEIWEKEKVTISSVARPAQPVWAVPTD